MIQRKWLKTPSSIPLNQDKPKLVELASTAPSTGPINSKSNGNINSKLLSHSPTTTTTTQTSVATSSSAPKVPLTTTIAPTLVRVPSFNPSTSSLNHSSHSYEDQGDEDITRIIESDIDDSEDESDIEYLGFAIAAKEAIAK